jgi:hypothetical protein
MNKKLLVPALVILATFLVAPAMAAAQKLDVRASAGDQFSHFDPTWPLSGFVVFNNPAGKLMITVSLKDGVACTTYGVYLEWYSDSTTWISYQYLGDLTTNKQGNGNFEAQLPLSPGTYYVQIAVGAGWDFKTSVTTVVIK